MFKKQLTKTVVLIACLSMLSISCSENKIKKATPNIIDSSVIGDPASATESVEAATTPGAVTAAATTAKSASEGLASATTKEELPEVIKQNLFTELNKIRKDDNASLMKDGRILLGNYLGTKIDDFNESAEELNKRNAKNIEFFVENPGVVIEKRILSPVVEAVTDPKTAGQKLNQALGKNIANPLTDAYGSAKDVVINQYNKAGDSWNAKVEAPVAAKFNDLQAGTANQVDKAGQAFNNLEDGFFVQMDRAGLAFNNRVASPFNNQVDRAGQTYNNFQAGAAVQGEKLDQAFNNKVTKPILAFNQAAKTDSAHLVEWTDNTLGFRVTALAESFYNVAWNARNSSSNHRPEKFRELLAKHEDRQITDFDKLVQGCIDERGAPSLELATDIILEMNDSNISESNEEIDKLMDVFAQKSLECEQEYQVTTKVIAQDIAESLDNRAENLRVDALTLNYRANQNTFKALNALEDNAVCPLIGTFSKIRTSLSNLGRKVSDKLPNNRRDIQELNEQCAEKDMFPGTIDDECVNQITLEVLNDDTIVRGEHIETIYSLIEVECK